VDDHITGAVAPQPTYRPANAVGAPSGYFMEPGWQQFSFDQQADHDAKEASVAAAIEAERLKNQLPQPVLEIAIVDSNFTSIGRRVWSSMPKRARSSAQRTRCLGRTLVLPRESDFQKPNRSRNSRRKNKSAQA
jgi:hypothetical protein